MAIAKIFVRSPYNYDADLVSNETGLKCEDASLAQQHQKDESDINVIVKRFGLTGELPANPRLPQYGDFTGIKDYQSALHAVQSAQEAFMEIPAEIRARFDNDPEVFLEFCANPANKEEAIKIGLIKKPEPETAPVLAPSAAPAPAQSAEAAK